MAAPKCNQSPESGLIPPNNGDTLECLEIRNNQVCSVYFLMENLRIKAKFNP